MTPSSNTRPTKKRKVDPLKSVVETLASLMRQQESMRQDQAADRAESRRLQEETNRRFASLTETMIMEQKQNREMWQQYLNKNEAMPIVSLQPASTSQQCLIQNQATGSNDNAVSILQEATTLLAPLPTSAQESDPPLPTNDTDASPSLPSENTKATNSEVAV